MLLESICEKYDKFTKEMIVDLNYIKNVIRNFKARFKGLLLTYYLKIYGCKVGKKLKCSGFPKFYGYLSENLSIGNNVDLGSNNTFELTKNGILILEDNVLFYKNILVSCNNKITFGKFSALAENVSVRDGGHLFAKNNYYRLQDCVSEPIEICEDTGIGAGCVVLMGSKVSKGAFIGANSVVIKKTVIQEYGIYAGNPIKLISTRN